MELEEMVSNGKICDKMGFPFQAVNHTACLVRYGKTGASRQAVKILGDARAGYDRHG